MSHSSERAIVSGELAELQSALAVHSSVAHTAAVTSAREARDQLKHELKKKRRHETKERALGEELLVLESCAEQPEHAIQQGANGEQEDYEKTIATIQLCEASTGDLMFTESETLITYQQYCDLSELPGVDITDPQIAAAWGLDMDGQGDTAHIGQNAARMMNALGNDCSEHLMPELYCQGYTEQWQRRMMYLDRNLCRQMCRQMLSAKAEAELNKEKLTEATKQLTKSNDMVLQLETQLRSSQEDNIKLVSNLRQLRESKLEAHE